MPVWLVTGGTGFLGRHLVDLLDRARPPGVDVVLLHRQPAQGSNGGSVHADLEDPSGPARAIAETEPEVVFHLAGRTAPGSPSAFYQGNTLATLHLLDALRARPRPVRVVLAGSAAELG